MSFYRTLALSDHWLPKALRRSRRAVANFGVPAPRFLVAPIYAALFISRHVWYFFYRVFVCEPLFKFHCASYGRNLHTGPFLHWLRGKGRLDIGDDVTIDGKCDFSFAVRYAEHPALVIGDRTGIGDGCLFTVAKRIQIGRNCRIANGVYMFDSPGHPTDPDRRRAGLPPDPEDVRPITIGDNVWIGTGTAIFPGVTVGDNSVIGVGSVVMNDVPANTVVMGNPARRVMSMEKHLAGN
jgi:acetyltransferase-like isoleucine patch superfamily enzyme